MRVYVCVHVHAHAHVDVDVAVYVRVYVFARVYDNVYVNVCQASWRLPQVTGTVSSACCHLPASPLAAAWCSTSQN